MQNAYGNFVKHVEEARSETDYTKIYRNLSITRIELSALEPLNRYEQGGGNVLKKAYLQKALSFLDSERELLEWKVQYPAQFTQPVQPIFKSNLHIIPKSTGLGIIALAEIVVGLFLSGEVKGPDGKPTSLIQIAKAFETIFNFSFGDIYEKRDAIFRRKPYNLAKILDFLSSAIRREDRKRNNR